MLSRRRKGYGTATETDVHRSVHAREHEPAISTASHTVEPFSDRPLPLGGRVKTQFGKEFAEETELLRRFQRGNACALEQPANTGGDPGGTNWVFEEPG